MAAQEEMAGLWKRGCFKKHRVQDLTKEQRSHSFGSRFYHKIKRHSQTVQIKSCKIQLVIMGNHMEKGEDFTYAFAPVPRSVVGRILMSMAAAANLEMHCVDLLQVFIQASWADLPEDTPQVFVRPPSGWDEEEGVVDAVLRPLYGIPSSARALHYTLAKWMKENKFKQSGFEESVWVRDADEQFPHVIHLSAHIDDTLILCESLETMTKFKQHFLSRFKGTDEGEVTEYLGCYIVRDRAARPLTLRQTSYIR